MRLLEDQRFGLVRRHRDFEALDLRDHRGDLGGMPGLPVEVAPDPLAQVARLADVEHLPATVQHAVHPRQGCELATSGTQAVEALVRLLAHDAASSSACARAKTCSNMAGVRRPVWVL